jgi:hypothetical protein
VPILVMLIGAFLVGVGVYRLWAIGDELVGAVLMFLGALGLLLGGWLSVLRHVHRSARGDRRD